MNSDIIPQGARAFITGAPTVITNALVVRALANITFTALVFKYPKAPTPSGAATAGSLAAGQQLEYVGSISVTGDVEVVYLP